MAAPTPKVEDEYESEVEEESGSDRDSLQTLSTESSLTCTTSSLSGTTQSTTDHTPKESDYPSSNSSKFKSITLKIVTSLLSCLGFNEHLSGSDVGERFLPYNWDRGSSGDEHSLFLRGHHFLKNRRVSRRGHYGYRRIGYRRITSMQARSIGSGISLDTEDEVDDSDEAEGSFSGTEAAILGD